MKHTKLPLKALIMLSFMFFALTNVSIADEIKYTDSWGKQGFQLTSQKTSGVGVAYSITEFNLAKSQINGETMDVIELPGHFLPNNEGAPNLPGMGRFIAIPQGANAELIITASRVETFSGIEMAPAPRIPWDTETGDLEYNKDAAIYSANAFYPESPVQLSAITQIRGVDVITLGITPFQYNPVTKELLVYRDLNIEIKFEGGNGQFGEDRLRSRWWDPIFSDMLLNYESLPKMNYNRSFQATDETGCEYLIISPTGPEFLQWADSIREFRTKQGILTDVVTVADAGGNTVNALESYFNNAYNNWDIVPAAVLLLGDYGTSQTNSIIAPIWDSYCASDNIYADVNGNDMPDMVFARMTAQNATHLQTMVTKFLNYERTPPTSADFYQNPITALGFQTERWFQICSEAVAGFWEVVHGKTSNRINAIYQGTPGSTWSTATNTAIVVNVFGPNGLGYIPAMPSQVNCTWNGTAANVVTGINNGAFMLQHRDHGMETGWGEPAFQSSHINSLNNTDLTFVWSINCLTGKYNMSGECFTEKFHRHTAGGNNSGALALNAASEVSYSFVNDTYVWGAFDNMWPEFLPDYGTTPESRGVMPAFASAAGKYFLQQSAWPYNTNNKEVTYNLFHHHGDAFTVVYSEIPQNLTVIHNPILYAGVTSFDVNANDGSLIALTVNGEIIGTAEGTGTPVTITIPGQQPPNEVLVTVTLQNYYRYEQYVEVIPPAGPYIVQNAVQINDLSGNGNGIMETSESIMATITVENVGVEQGENISVSINTADPYVTITDNSEFYGSVAAGATAFVTDGFAWDVANNIPDMHQVIFEMNATDGTDTWTTYFSVEGHGPNLEIGSITIDDYSGNGNARLDPGETADVKIETSNTGSFEALNTIANLSCSSPYITINTSVFNFNIIGAGLMEEATFNITVDAATPVGTIVNFMYDVTSGGYNVQQSYTISVGLIVEDWETGDLSQYPWETGGSNSWAISQQNPYEGTYCVKSGTINHNQNTWLSLDYEVANTDVISFWFKVSSEANYDFLEFSIDGNVLSSSSGEVGWEFAEFPVTAGNHTFKWEYSKDYSVASGGDCAWVDYILLPASPTMTAYAGQDDAVCEGNTYQCNGAATLYMAVLWTSSGTGSFDNAQNLNAVYTPSGDDITAGSVTLTLTAYNPGSSVMDDMILSINPAPLAYAGEDAIVYSNESYTLADATAENFLSVQWTTSGDGTFDDEFIINPVYTLGTNDIINGEVTLTFTVYGNDGCDEVSDDMLLSINTVGYEDFSDNAAVSVYPNPAAGNFTLYLNTRSVETVNILIYSSLGDRVFEKQNINVNIKYSENLSLDLPEGIYYLRVEGEGLLLNEKIIIKK
jgi:hypothetical protein